MHTNGEVNKTSIESLIPIYTDLFEPKEAMEMVKKIIEDQINTYKVMALSDWIKNHDVDQSNYEEKINELQKMKASLPKMITTPEKFKTQKNTPSYTLKVVR